MYFAHMCIIIVRVPGIIPYRISPTFATESKPVKLAQAPVWLSHLPSPPNSVMSSVDVDDTP